MIRDTRLASMLRDLVNGVLPLGSNRRNKVVTVARRAGVIGPAVPTPYERWISTTEHLLVPTRSSGLTTAFRISIDADLDTSPVDVNRSLLSLQAQTHQSWSAGVNGAPETCSTTLSHWLAAESRVTSATDPTHPLDRTAFLLHLRAGDVLAPWALSEAAHVAHDAANSGTPVDLISADFDYFARGSNRRLLPHRFCPSDVDATCQFDNQSGFTAVATNSPTDNRSTVFERQVHVAQILLHKQVPIGVNTNTLAMHLHPPAPLQTVHSYWPGVACEPDPQGFGTWVRHRATPEHVGAVHVVLTDPVTDSNLSSAHHHAMRTLLERSDGTDGIPYRFADSVRRNGGWVAVRDSIKGLADNDVVVIVDGVCTFDASDAVVDLVGVAARADVFAVAPLVTSPSGIVIDAGIDSTPRFGHLLQPPYDLVWARSVRALSGRVVALKASSIHALALAAGSSTTLRISESEQRRLVVWPHVRAVARFAVAAGSDAPPTQVWRTPRLASWFDADLSVFSPASDAITESFW